jgi:hypothetical protein
MLLVPFFKKGPPLSCNQRVVVAGLVDYRGCFGRHGDSGIGDGLPDKGEGVGN